MDFRPDPTLVEFRQEVRHFLNKQIPADLPRRAHGMRSQRETVMQWQRILNAHGWGAPYWQEEHGGTGWTVPQRLAFDEECAAAGVPSQDAFAQKLVGPVINHFGTPAQKAEHIGAILRGERLWCQGFSEPGSGSDLASLRTQAVRDGDEYVINGQKIWTSYAHHTRLDLPAGPPPIRRQRSRPASASCWWTCRHPASPCARSSALTAATI